MTAEQVREWLACVDLARKAKETGVETLLLGLVIWRLVRDLEESRGVRLLIVGEGKQQAIAVFLPPASEPHELPGHLLHSTFRLLVGDKLQHPLSGLGKPTAPPAVYPAPNPALVKQVIGRLKSKGLTECMLAMPILASTIFDDSHPYWGAMIKPVVDAFTPEGK